MTRLTALLALLACASSPVLPAAPLPTAARQPPPPDDPGWHASTHVLGTASHREAGYAGNPEPFVYWYRAAGGVAIGVHRHNTDERIRVVTGRKFILMGNPPESAKVQRFDAGQSLVIPARTWHVEWFETDTVEEISGVGPLTTERPPEFYPER